MRLGRHGAGAWERGGEEVDQRRLVPPRSPGHDEEQERFDRAAPFGAVRKMIDTDDTPAPAEEIDPSAGWDDKRRRYEQTKAEQNRRGGELAKYREPQRPIVEGRHRFLKRARR